MTARPEGLALFAAAFAWPLLSPASMVQSCCTHQGQNVQCPAGLPPGSGSVQFVPGGTQWAVPGKGTVFVPQTAFAACTTKPPGTSTPSTPTTTPSMPTTTPSTPATSQPAPAPTTPATSQPTPSTPASGTSTPGTPASSTTPAANTPRWPIPPVGPQETDLQARPLNEPDTSIGPVPMQPGGGAKAIDQSIERVKRLREEQERTPTPVAPPGTTPGTVAKTPDKPQASAKAPPPKSCGPDVTDYVLGVLQMIEDTYKNSWDAAERAKRCGSLYGLGFQAAWDLQGFTPSDGESYMPEIFFQRAAPNACAIPRNPCGSTVVFLGFCVNAQVVNYVQWGLMNELCGTQERGIAAQSVRSVFSSNSTGQKIMSELGEDFAGIGYDLDFKKRVLKRIIDKLVRDNENDWYDMEGTDCPLVCDQSVAAPWLENFSWGFQWGPEDVPITKRGTELKKP